MGAQRDRIRARTIRRAGELLKQLDGRGDHRKTEDDHGSLVTQTEAARAAGLSAHQQVQAIRVANVPADVFDTCIEDERPATVTQLAETISKCPIGHFEKGHTSHAREPRRRDQRQNFAFDRRTSRPRHGGGTVGDANQRAEEGRCGNFHISV